MDMHRLITIAFSHYNEKARWALERFGVQYVEEAYMPMFHAVGVLKLAPRYGVGKATKHSSPLATPVLVTDDDRCIRGSAAILHDLSDRFATPGRDLYPTSEAAELEERFSNGLGPDTRRIAYLHLLEDAAGMSALASANVGRGQAWLFRRCQPIVRWFVGTRLGITPGRAKRALDRVRSEFAEFSDRLRGREFLVGNRFTAADLAFACMVAPIILPSRDDGYGAALPSLAQCSAEYQGIVRELRATEAGAFALRMFREHRRARG